MESVKLKISLSEINQDNIETENDRPTEYYDESLSSSIDLEIGLCMHNPFSIEMIQKGIQRVKLSLGLKGQYLNITTELVQEINHQVSKFDICIYDMFFIRENESANKLEIFRKDRVNVLLGSELMNQSEQPSYISDLIILEKDIMVSLLKLFNQHIADLNNEQIRKSISNLK